MSASAPAHGRPGRQDGDLRSTAGLGRGACFARLAATSCRSLEESSFEGVGHGVAHDGVALSVGCCESETASGRGSPDPDDVGSLAPLDDLHWSFLDRGGLRHDHSRPPFPQSEPGPAGRAQPRAADVLVIFGITGDLAKVMTFRSLYRLEARGLLDCPILGVAAQDWSVQQLRDHARACIEGTGETIDDAVFERSPPGCRTWPATSPTPPRSNRWPPRSPRRAAPCSIWRSRRSCSAR